MDGIDCHHPHCNDTEAAGSVYVRPFFSFINEEWDCTDCDCGQHYEVNRKLPDELWVKMGIAWASDKEMPFYLALVKLRQWSADPLWEEFKSPPLNGKYSDFQQWVIEKAERAS